MRAVRSLGNASQRILSLSLAHALLASRVSRRASPSSPSLAPSCTVNHVGCKNARASVSEIAHESLEGV